MRTLSLHLAVLVFLLGGNASIGIGQMLGTFTPTGDMSVPRAFHTATLLANGKVLIVGGVGITASVDTQSLMTAELYDPNTRTLTRTGDMTTPRVSPTATLLNDGRVLIVGNEYKPNEKLRNTADLYDPRTGTFTKTGDSVTNQTGGGAVLLNDGKVLILGGWKAGPSDQPNTIANPELYDPLSGTFAATGPFATTGSTPSSFYVAGGPDISAISLLADGRVLIAGKPTSELYDPIANSFRLTSSMTTQCFMNGGSPGYIHGRTADRQSIADRW
jgi:Kelch motif